MCLWERRVRIGRETKIEVKIQSDRKNHTGHNRHRRSRGRRGVRDLHTVLPSSSNSNTSSKPSAELWNIYTGRRTDIHASHSGSRPALRHSLQLHVWTSNNSDKRSYHQDSNRGTSNRRGGMPTTLSLIAPGDTCTSTAGIALAQSTAVSIPTGSYNYCATGTSAAVTGVVSFTVAWA